MTFCYEVLSVGKMWRLVERSKCLNQTLKRIDKIVLNCDLRSKSTEHWAQIRSKTFPKQLALQHFDNFYSKVYERSWKSIRLGLLSPQKYCAVVNLFSNYEDIEIKMRQLGAVDIRQYYERHWKRYERYQRRLKILAEKKAKKIAYLAQQSGVDVSQINAENVEVSDVSDRDLGTGFSSMTEAEDFVEMLSENQGLKDDGFINAASVDIDLNDFIPATEYRYEEEIVTEKSYYEFYDPNTEITINRIEEPKLDIPEILKIYSYPRGNVCEFPAPQRSKSLGVIDYFLMDGASIIPVLALGIEKQDFVADYCAAPGGKALIMALSLRPSKLVCNDLSLSRSVRLKNVFKSFIPELNSISNLIEFSNEDAKLMRKQDYFDKILVDVACTNDRHSTQENDNNIFRPSRLSERIKIPEDQKAILYSALISLKPNGCLVYSTCSLSPIQNDGVVHMTLKKIWEETKYEFVVCDLKETLRPLRGLFKFWNKSTFGTQILPFIPSNYGPMYVCKLKRIK